MNDIKYGGVSAVEDKQDTPVTLTLTGAAARRIMQWLIKKNASRLPTESPVWCLWAVLTDVYPTDE